MHFFIAAFAEIPGSANLRCAVPRLDEIVGEIGFVLHKSLNIAKILSIFNRFFIYFRAEFTLIPFFFVYDDSTAQSGISYLNPTELVQPSDVELEAALEVAGLVNIDVREVPVFKNVQNSFGLFVDGVIYEEDIDSFLQALTQFWRQSNGGAYPAVTCVNGFIEKYFTSIDA